MSTMLNFEVIFNKFKIYGIHSKVKLTTILTNFRIKKLLSSKVDFIRSGRYSAY